MGTFITITRPKQDDTGDPGLDQEIDQDKDVKKKRLDSRKTGGSKVSFKKNTPRTKVWASSGPKQKLSKTQQKDSIGVNRSDDQKFDVEVDIPEGVKDPQDVLDSVAQEISQMLGAPVKAKPREKEQGQGGGGGGTGAGGAPLNQFAQNTQSLSDFLSPQALSPWSSNGSNPGQGQQNPNVPQTLSPEIPITGETTGTGQTTTTPVEAPSGKAADGTPLSSLSRLEHPRIIPYGEMPKSLAPTGTYRDVDPALEAQLADDNMIRTVYGKAYGEAGGSFMGRVAVVSNMINRAQQGNFYGKGLARNATAPQQYVAPIRALSPAQLAEGRAVISALVRGQLQDPTGGKTSFRSSRYISGTSAQAAREFAADGGKWGAKTMGPDSKNSWGNSYFNRPGEYNKKGYIHFDVDPSITAGRTDIIDTNLQKTWETVRNR